MQNNWRMAVLFILIGILFAITPFVGTLSNPLLWLTALVFLVLGIYRIVKALKK